MKPIKNINWGIILSSLVFLVCAASANADTLHPITTVSGITGNVQIGGGADSGASYATFDDQSGGSQTSFTENSGSLSVVFSGNGGTAPGGIGGGAAPSPPWLSGNNDVNFASATTPNPLPSGGEADPSTFLAAGSGAGSFALSFLSTQDYLGLVWGSIDFAEGAFGQPDNVLTFYTGPDGTGTVVAAIDGLDIADTDPNIDHDLSLDGSTDITGTAYVNLNVAGGFESVVATSGNFTFEIDNVAYAGTAVPEPSTNSMILLGLASLLGLNHLRRKSTGLINSQRI